jgi:flagellar hook protein FlgE
MLRSLNTAVSGLQEFQQRIDVIGNNIANVNTVAYKGARATSADSFSETLQDAVGGAIQVGTGVSSGNVSSVFTQGGLMQTGAPTDLAIAGQGFFTVKDTLTGQTYATRDGSFEVDKAGYLVTSGSHFRVQGFADSALATQGDVKIDATGAPATAKPGARVASYLIDEQGRVQVALDDGTTFARSQVLLQNYSAPQALRKEGQNLFSNLDGAQPLTQPVAPGSSGLGTLEAGYLEMSNVDLTSEFSSLITAQRGFQANSRIVTTSDELLQEVINLKR